MFFLKLLLVLPTTERMLLFLPNLVWLLSSDPEVSTGPLTHLRFIIPMSLIASQQLQACTPANENQLKQNKTMEDLRVSGLHTISNFMSLAVSLRCSTGVRLYVDAFPTQPAESSRGVRKPLLEPGVLVNWQFSPLF